ncbi:MAG: ribose-phosphate diphosphokinase [Phenylobacterium sp.]|uniref:ribose-phosphate diphosphokinase n=1 Tax=Phenylobacterium sp. TaxID=1871053 RepID=UPI0025EC4899|nr:ribose-phosphate diphosphokinase [Phenylobacterium sp.]MCA6230777.1 ribose-phosphate diphosphokinase [Phenylobacterium sp.]MCA6253185.1 ribose-phosphate diphosphokinase [Phenylobacterium sp.]MCA6264531.1 ribose-phosphate diphosphokinase [Phenylobacterium sp.]MCA6266896.1 ribose-phosphate diphosphokinase [Phenylobacterium sp.]MCA6269404.1 ribose-phosphate diphosphokinase [Phenylobacterium sp.]
MSPEVHALPDEAGPAGRFAGALGLPLRLIRPHAFPDGESRPVVMATAGSAAILYRSLARPDGRLMPLLLAADALRRAGAARVDLVAPYLPYMRQDRVFAPGEPLSQAVIGRVLSGAFDRILTLEAHLHRTPDLAGVFPGRVARNAGGGEVLAEALAHLRPRVSLVAGPDSESAAWAGAVARRLGAGVLVAGKRRLGDRDVTVQYPDDPRLDGAHIALVDDICSSGGTLAAAARALKAAGAARITAAVVHGLHDARTVRALKAAGIDRLIVTDSVAGPGRRLPVAGALARAWREMDAA